LKVLVETWKGIVFILLIILLNALIWWYATPIITQSLESKLGQIMASNIIIIFTFVFFLSTKNRLVTWLFNGLENVYIYHRSLAIIGILFIFLHTQFAYLIYQYFRPDLPIRPALMGLWARNIFIFLAVFALLAKYLNYERWRMIHRLMIIPYLMAIYHAVFISSYDLLSFSVLGVWMNALVLVGIVSSFYMIVLYRKTAFSYKGKVSHIHYPTKSVTEIGIKLNEKYPYKYGQFAFMKINRPPFKGVPHPFSISGGQGDQLSFTIKALGDFTELLHKELHVEDEIYLTKPYGHMTFEDYGDKQVWIAGGIGITPFLSYLRNKENLKQDITLYYSVKSKEEAVHLEHFMSLNENLSNFNFVLWESNKDGLLSVDSIDLSGNPIVFMCGPVSMARALKKQFRKTDKHQKLIYEAFSFTGTIANDIEKIIRESWIKVRRK
jgi:predicted ferric reductase